MTYHGRNGITKYVMGSCLGHGAEGDVYELVGRHDLVAKLYNEDRFDAIPEVSDGRQYLKDKILCMLRFNFDPYTGSGANRVLLVAWPRDVLIDGSGRFVGFVMPRVRSTDNLLKAYAPSERPLLERHLLSSHFTWKTRLAIARNLALGAAYHHDHGIVIGDFNTNNVLINSDCTVTYVDADSFNVTDVRTGRVFKCMMGVGEVLAPELQGKYLPDSGSIFTKESDNFSLAIHVFYLLTDHHPFGGLSLAVASQSVTNPVETNIARGNCAYVTKATVQPQPDAPDIRHLMPSYLRELFDRAFTYTVRTAVRKETIAKRPTAREWLNALDRALAEPMKTCRRDSTHVYIDGLWKDKSYDGCPWCECKARLQLVQWRGVAQPGQAKSSSASPSVRVAQMWNATAAVAPRLPAGQTGRSIVVRSQQATAAQIHGSSSQFMPLSKTSAVGKRILRGAWPLWLVCVLVGLLVGPAMLDLFLRYQASKGGVVPTPETDLIVMAVLFGAGGGGLVSYVLQRRYLMSTGRWSVVLVSIALLPLGVLAALLISTVVTVLVGVAFELLALAIAFAFLPLILLLICD